MARYNELCAKLGADEDFGKDARLPARRSSEPPLRGGAARVGLRPVGRASGGLLVNADNQVLKAGEHAAAVEGLYAVGQLRRAASTAAWKLFPMDVLGLSIGRAITQAATWPASTLRAFSLQLTGSGGLMAARTPDAASSLSRIVGL